MKTKKRNRNSKMNAFLTTPSYLHTVGQEGVVRFIYIAEGRNPPATGRFFGDLVLLEAAWSAGHATLLAFDDYVRVRVTGFSMEDGALTVLAAPVFKALVTRIKNAA